MDARYLHGLAATQNWLLKEAQILDHITEWQLEWALRRGELITVFPRVYKPWGAPEWWEQRVQAACWSVDGTASHRCAARVQRIEVAASRIELTVPYPRRVRMRGLKVHSSNLLLPEFVTEVDGIPVTTPDRTCLDLSAVCGRDTLERAWGSAAFLDLVTPDSLLRTAIKMRARGRRRWTTVDELLQKWVPDLDLKDVELQARTLAWIRADGGFEEPEIEFWVVLNGRRFRIDLAWPRRKICIECDGWAGHGRNRLQFDNDRDKIPELELAGWLAIPTSSRQSREVVLDRLRRAFALRPLDFSSLDRV
jgi:hypothetical protein